jgi:hypothetical protein
MMLQPESRRLAAIVCFGLCVTVAAAGCRSRIDQGDRTKPTTTSAPVEELIIDNHDPGCKIISGQWELAGSSDGNGSWKEDFLYLLADRKNVGRVRFAPAVSTKAVYDVSIYWSADQNRTTDQPVIVHDANGKDTTYRVNLRQHGRQWYALGKHIMAPSGCWIEFTNDTDEGYCNADAVRLTR